MLVWFIKPAVIAAILLALGGIAAAVVAALGGVAYLLVTYL